MADGMSYVLWGSAGHAKVLASLIALRGGRVIALFDNNPNAKSSIEGVPLVGGHDNFVTWAQGGSLNSGLRGLVAIGGHTGLARVNIQKLFLDHGVLVEPIVHPDATLCATASLGAGTQVLARATVASEATLGEGCIVNHGAVVDHECVIGDGVHIAPGATLCGCITVERNVMIGAGSVVLPRVVIGASSVIGAGAVVTKDVPAGTTVVGNPARIIRQIKS